MILLKNDLKDFKWLIRHIDAGDIKVIIDKTYPLEQAKEAQVYSQSGRARGKIVLTV